jgi:hypothetical protein
VNNRACYQAPAEVDLAVGPTREQRQDGRLAGAPGVAAAAGVAAAGHPVGESAGPAEGGGQWPDARTRSGARFVALALRTAGLGRPINCVKLQTMAIYHCCCWQLCRR